MAQVTMVEAVKMMNELVEELEAKHKSEISERDKKIAELEQKLAEANAFIAIHGPAVGTQPYFDKIPTVECAGNSSSVTVTASSDDGATTANASKMFEQAEPHIEPCAIPIEKRTGPVFGVNDVSAD